MLVVGAAFQKVAFILLAELSARLRAAHCADGVEAVVAAASTAVTDAAAIINATVGRQQSVTKVVSMTAVVPAVLANFCLTVSILRDVPGWISWRAKGSAVCSLMWHSTWAWSLPSALYTTGTVWPSTRRVGLANRSDLPPL